MGCGASIGTQRNQQRKYEVDLNSLGDDPKQPLNQPISSTDLQPPQEVQPEAAPQKPKGGPLHANRYLAGATDGVDLTEGLEIIEGGDDLSQAQVAATQDANLLKKYVDQNAQGKKRPMNKRVFQPSNGPLSGEPMAHAALHHKQNAVEEDLDTVQNHTVGALKLQYR
mmetsp:Transcript_56321/g.104167  ORF Transcript_56321/g.104167 Transcript_56321/m.104167 type:complete len:168 (-) Transcript_56321:79-582(-)